MKQRVFIFVCAAFLIGGCASMDRNRVSSFEPYTDITGNMMFKFRADTDSITYPESSEKSEAIRMEWLEEYLRSNTLCGQGYEIIERKPMVKSSTSSGPVHSVYYVGRCKELQCW
jgi:hypothetical protein